MYTEGASTIARGGWIVIVPAWRDAPMRIYDGHHDTPQAVMDKFVPGKKQ